MRRPAPEHFPPRPCTLTEDDVRDAFALRERNQAVCRAVGLDADHGRAEALGESDVLPQRLRVVRVDPVRLLALAFRHTRRTTATPSRPAMRAPVRITRGASAFELMHTITRSGISAGSSPSRSR